MNNYKTIDLNTYQIENPIFDYNQKIYTSKLVNPVIKSQNLRIMSIINGSDQSDCVIKTEFMPWSNNFYDFVQKSESHIKNLIVTKSVDLFGHSVNSETIGNLFKGSIFLPDKIPNLPTMNFIIVIKKDKPDCKLINSKGKNMKFSDLTNDMEVEISYDIRELTFHKTKCYLSYVVKEIKVINNICASLECLLNSSETNDASDS